MNPRASVSWPSRPKRLWPRRLAVGAGACAGTLVLSQYLAGFLFLAWARMPVQRASPLTVSRYGWYFGERGDIRRALWVSSVAGILVVLLCGSLVWLPKRRSLHGDARF